MRKIDRGAPLERFTDFLVKHKPHQWNELEKDPGLRKEMQKRLLCEQGEMSGYTERPIADSSTLHIDHFRKQDLFKSQEYVFGWYNFVVDEHNPNYGADHKDNRTIVKSASDYDKIIDPIKEDPHLFFDIMANGGICPKSELEKDEAAKAEFTISVFNLNHPSLVNQRMQVMRDVENLAGLISDNDIVACYAPYGFLSTVEQVLANRKH